MDYQAAEVLASHHERLAREADQYAGEAMDEGHPAEAAMWAEEARTRRHDAERWRRTAEEVTACASEYLGIL